MKTNFNHDNFYTKLPKHKTKNCISIDFLTWFLGFFEAAGCFEKDGRIKITQSSKDIQVLYRIRTIIGFGKISKDNSTSSGIITHRWRTDSNVETAVRLALLFNNNILTRNKLNCFKRWIEHWNKNEEFVILLGENFKLQEKPAIDKISFKNSWLSGFIDGDGCWSISLSKSLKKPIASIRLMIASEKDPKFVDDAIVMLGMGRRNPKSSNKNLSFTVSKKLDIDKLISYINVFPHKTKKSISFIKFCKARRRIEKKEHYGNGSDKLKRLISSINLNNRST
jgi:hypothetical protein